MSDVLPLSEHFFDYIGPILSFRLVELEPISDSTCPSCRTEPFKLGQRFCHACGYKLDTPRWSVFPTCKDVETFSNGKFTIYFPSNPSHIRYVILQDEFEPKRLEQSTIKVVELNRTVIDNSLSSFKEDIKDLVKWLTDKGCTEFKVQFGALNI